MDSNPYEFTLSLMLHVLDKIHCSGKAQTSVICRIRKKPKVSLLLECGKNSGRQLLTHLRKPKVFFLCSGDHAS